MATLLNSPSVRERNNGLFLVEPAVESVAIPQRLFRNLLVVEPASFLNLETARVFRAANYATRSVRAWHHAIEWVERGDPDVVLLDLDAIDQGRSSVNVSSHRLVALLRRAAGARPVTLAGISQRDFCEMEEVIRSGLNLFMPRTLSHMRLIQRIEATRSRQTQGSAIAG